MPNRTSRGRAPASSESLVTAVVCLALAAVVAAMASLNVALMHVALLAAAGSALVAVAGVLLMLARSARPQRQGGLPGRSGCEPAGPAAGR